MVAMLFFHSESAATWELIADCGSWMVVVGVAAEVVDLSIKVLTALRKKRDGLKAWLAGGKIERCVHSCEEHEGWMACWEFFWWAIVVLGLMVEVGGNHEARKIGDRENLRLTQRVEELRGSNLELSKAVHELAHLYDQSTNALAEANARLAEANFRLAVNPPPRHLDAYQEVALANALHKISHENVDFKCSASDKEAMSFVDDLARVFAVAGWKFKAGSIVGVSPNVFSEGVTVVDKGTHGVGQSVRDALSTIGIKVSAATNHNEADMPGFLYVLVGTNPTRR